MEKDIKLCSLVIKNLIEEYENAFDDDSISEEKYNEMEKNLEMRKEQFVELFGKTYEDYLYETTPMFVNVYHVTRHFGGHEEGGWWYNWYDCVEVYPVRNGLLANEVKEWLEKEHGKGYGDIYSVNGGLEIYVEIERKPKQSETTERPYYE